jgi:hypothetical protein
MEMLRREGELRVASVRALVLESASCETTSSAVWRMALRCLGAGRGVIWRGIGWYTQVSHGGYSSVAERRSVDPDVVGSTPTSRPKREANKGRPCGPFSWPQFIRTIELMNSRAFMALTIDCD